MAKALFVVDMQNGCIGEKHAKFFKYDRHQLIQAVNDRIAEYESENVFYICQIMKKNLISMFAPMKAYKGSYEAAIAEDIHVVSDNIVLKYVGDAFSNPKLKDMLNEKEIDEIEIAGIDGGGCVALTALGALKNNYKVSIHESAVGTMFVKKAEKYKKILLDKGCSIWYK